MRLKSELYTAEQEEILKKLFNILDLDGENSITLYELDNNIDKQKAISNLIQDIRKYYSFSNVIGIKEPDKCKRSYLSIIKCIVKNKYNMYHSNCRITINNEKIRTVKYIFIKKNT